MVVPPNGTFLKENPNLKRMITRDTPMTQQIPINMHSINIKIYPPSCGCPTSFFLFSLMGCFCWLDPPHFSSEQLDTFLLSENITIPLQQMAGKQPFSSPFSQHFHQTKNAIHLGGISNLKIRHLTRHTTEAGLR